MEALGGLAVGAGLLLGLYALLYYNFGVATWCKNAVSLRGKTVLITGGNAGIGKATAVDLARRGARVILACRNKARGESAMYDIRRESGNSEVILMILDLGRLNSVRAFAQNFLDSEPRLDILINNAGVVGSDGFDRAFQVNHLGHFLLTHLLLDRLKCCALSRIIILSSSSHSFGKMDFRTIHKPVEGMWKAVNKAGIFQDGQTSDGFDRAFQVNHLAHFLLTHLLLDWLKRCAPSRVVIVASNMHFYGKMDFQTIHKPAEGMWKALCSYGNSKLANILHTRELASRLEGTNVTCYAVHPGSVRTKMGHSCPWWVIWFLRIVNMFNRDCEAGAQTSIYCATEEGIERLSGQYFMDCQVKVPSPQACDDQLAKKLWEFSERLLGLTT